MGITIRRLAAVLLLVASVAGLAGCWRSGPSEEETRLANENKTLQEQLRALGGEKDRLSRDLADARGRFSAVRLEADQWKAKYEEAGGATAPRGGTLPPDLLKTFLEIAQSGGAWSLGPTGSIKASADVLFDAGDVELKPAGQDAVKAIAAKLQEILTDERVMLRVDGHTDDSPIRHSKWKDNLHLSLMRARAMVDALAAAGVPAKEMCAAGFGEWHPVAPNDSDAGRARNRRVELSLISVSAPPAAPAP